MASTTWEAMRRRLWRGAKIAAVLAAAAAIIYWLKFSPAPVRAHRVETGTMVEEVLGTGTLEARVKSTISPKIAGRILEILVDQGDSVQSGQLLLKLDDSELNQQVQIAQANVAAAEAGLDRLKADHHRAQVVLDQSRKDHDRTVQLIASRAVSESERDKAVEALGVGEAGLARAEAALAEGRQLLNVALQTLEYHRARLADTQVKAPFDGLIVRRQRDPGDVVVPGSPVLTLVSTEVLWISAWIDETEMAKLQPGLPAKVVFRSQPERAYTGEVMRLGRETDRETREFIVDVRVLDLPDNWAVGQRAEVYVEVGRHESVTVLPAEYVVWRSDQAGVFADSQGRAEWRSLRLGVRQRDAVEVLAGIEPGERAVKAAQLDGKLMNGRRITEP